MTVGGKVEIGWTAASLEAELTHQQPLFTESDHFPEEAPVSLSFQKAPSSLTRHPAQGAMGRGTSQNCVRTSASPTYNLG